MGSEEPNRHLTAACGWWREGWESKKPSWRKGPLCYDLKDELKHFSQLELGGEEKQSFPGGTEWSPGGQVLRGLEQGFSWVLSGGEEDIDHSL